MKFLLCLPKNQAYCYINFIVIDKLKLFILDQIVGKLEMNFNPLTANNSSDSVVYKFRTINFRYIHQ